jgi:hypothetical protein
MARGEGRARAAVLVCDFLRSPDDSQEIPVTRLFSFAALAVVSPPALAACGGSSKSSTSGASSTPSYGGTPPKSSAPTSNAPTSSGAAFMGDTKAGQTAGQGRDAFGGPWWVVTTGGTALTKS